MSSLAAPDMEGEGEGGGEMTTTLHWDSDRGRAV